MKLLTVFFLALIFGLMIHAMLLSRQAHEDRFAAYIGRNPYEIKAADDLDRQATVERVAAGISFVLFLVFAVIAHREERKERNSKKCPRCAETVKAEAVICRFCQYAFPPAGETRLKIKRN